MLEKLIHFLPHAGTILRDENESVFMMISKALSETSMDSKIKSYSRRKYIWAAFLALITNHVGDTKYKAIGKYRSNLLHNIKWNVHN